MPPFTPCDHPLRAAIPPPRKALAELRARMEAGQYGSPGDELLKWYLRDRYFSVEDAEEKLTSMLRWRQQERCGGRGGGGPGTNEGSACLDG